MYLAESKRFELLIPFGMVVFKTTAISHSANSPFGSTGGVLRCEPLARNNILLPPKERILNCTHWDYGQLRKVKISLCPPLQVLQTVP